MIQGLRLPEELLRKRNGFQADFERLVQNTRRKLFHVGIFRRRKHALPLYCVRIDSNLRFEVASFGWFLPNNHEIYTEHNKHSMSFVSVSSLTTELQAYNVCPGLPLS